MPRGSRAVDAEVFVYAGDGLSDHDDADDGGLLLARV